VITLSTFAHRRDTTPEPVTFETLAECAAFFEHDRRDDKDGPLFSPAEYRAGARRGNRGVLRLHALILDFDHVAHTTIDTMRERIEGLGLEAWIYSTHSYDPADDLGACFRVVLPFAEPVAPEAWAAVWRAARDTIGPECDPACKDPARVYYAPSARPDAPVVSLHFAGVRLDARDLDGLDAPEPAAHVEAPTSTPEAAEITPGIVAWARRQCIAWADRIKAAPCPGPIYPTLNAAAFACGRYTPHVLGRAEVRGILAAAHAARNPAAVEKNDAILDRGLDDGAAAPWIPAAWYDLTDDALAAKLARECGGRLRYVPEWRKWIGWSGRAWRHVGDDGAAFEGVRDLAAALRTEAEYADDARAKALRGAARKLASFAGASSVERMARRRVEFVEGAAAWDADPWLLGTPNGTLDLRNGTLHEPLAEHRITRSTRAAFDLDARAPVWRSFVEQVTGGDPEFAAYLQRAVGYSLTAHHSEQCLFFLYGDGANGKSTFVNAILHALGDYATSTPSDLLLRSNTDKHPTGLAGLFGRRFVASTEVDDGRSWDEPLVKLITGGDPIQARRMREDFWEFRPTHKLWISGNYRPGVRGHDAGIWRRLRLIPFTESFRGRPDRALGAKLEGEAAGILAWAVEGCLRWQREGLAEPARVLEATADYREDQDHFGQFVAERLDVRADGHLDRQTLIALYATWAHANGAPILSARGLAERARKLPEVCETKREGRRGWQGLAVRSANPGLRAVG
jgi:P4 family phage/plasmid primase-like protien